MLGEAIYQLRRWSIFRQSPSNIQKQLHLPLLSLWTVNLKVSTNLSQSNPHICPSPETFVFPFFLTTTHLRRICFYFHLPNKIKRIEPTLIWHVPCAWTTIRKNCGKFRHMALKKLSLFLYWSPFYSCYIRFMSELGTYERKLAETYSRLVFASHLLIMEQYSSFSTNISEYSPFLMFFLCHVYFLLH